MQNETRKGKSCSLYNTWPSLHPEAHWARGRPVSTMSAFAVTESVPPLWHPHPTQQLGSPQVAPNLGTGVPHLCIQFKGGCSRLHSPLVPTVVGRGCLPHRPGGPRTLGGDVLVAISVTECGFQRGPG